MNLKEIIKHFTHNIVDLNENQWKVIEVSDIKEICKEYHKQQLTMRDVGCSNLPDRLDMTSQKDEMSLEKVKNPKLKDVFSWKVGFTDCYEWIEKMQ